MQIVKDENDPRIPTKTETFKKVGRNELCPCGSGRKFKKCHWK
jgi:preprotein translocase subunit SecA